MALITLESAEEGIKGLTVSGHWTAVLSVCVCVQVCLYVGVCLVLASQCLIT